MSVILIMYNQHFECFFKPLSGVLVCKILKMKYHFLWEVSWISFSLDDHFLQLSVVVAAAYPVHPTLGIRFVQVFHHIDPLHVKCFYKSNCFVPSVRKYFLSNIFFFFRWWGEWLRNESVITWLKSFCLHLTKLTQPLDSKFDSAF